MVSKEEQGKLFYYYFISIYELQSICSPKISDLA